MDFIDAVPSYPRTNTERQTTFRRTKAGRIAHRASNRAQNDRQYRSREFIAWDGEGVTRSDGSHDYVLLGNSQGVAEHSRYGLGMARIFDTILRSATNNPNGIHVIFGGGYDFNMFLKELTRDELELIYRSTFPVMVRGYKIGWRPGKALYISDGDRSVTLYDVISFFQCSFVKACDKYLGGDWLERATIVEQKANRSSFDYADIDAIIYYCRAELINLVRLMGELRERLDRVGLRLKRWDGPGAIASALMTERGIKHHKDKGNIPDEAARAGRVAYAGGRFEVIRFGRTDEPVWEYDINSAYPAAMRTLPSLSGATWRHRAGHTAHQSEYALYRLRWSDAPPYRPGPLFYRHENGTISYPAHGEGWYWSPDYGSAMAYAKADTQCVVECLEWWECVPADDVKPFAFVEPLYNKRRALKAAGDGAEMGLKLALNSLYGKLAQQVGWRVDTRGVLRIPPFHQLEWAGYVTSYARAMVASAALTNPDAVIAFETDAVFSSEPLDVVLGSGLGEWSETQFRNLTYVQSGVYFGESVNGQTVTSKTRGVDLGSLTRNAVEARMQLPDAADRFAETSLTRFVGAGIALTQSFDRWCKWETQPKQLRLSPTGKREHWSCNCVGPGINLGLHRTVCPFNPTVLSAEYPVAWINPDPAMAELEALRYAHYEEEYE